MLALAALLGLAAAQLDLSDRNVLSVDASVYLHIEVDQVYYKKAAGSANTTSDRVVFQFSKAGLALPVKDKLTDEQASLTTLTRPYFFQSSVCVATAWNATGKASLPKPVVVVDDYDTYIYQYLDYADILMYSDFERPFFEFQADAFVQGTASNSCLPATADVVSRQNFTERLCYTEDSFCNVWVGDNSDGWLYFGGGNTSTTGNFGIHVNPRWNWTGTRELFGINATNLLDVRAVDSSSDSFNEAKSLLSRTQSVPFEFSECKTKEDGVLLFHINPNRYLERQLSCNSLEWEDYTSVVFDFANTFNEDNLKDIKLPNEDRWNFTFNIVRVKYASSFDIAIDPENYLEPWVELNRLPKGYYLSGADWLTTITFNSGKMDVVKTWFTVEKAAAQVTTTATPVRVTVTTAAPPKCPKDCNSHGTCQSSNSCLCSTGFLTDATEGCVAESEATTALSTTAPPTITTAAGFSGTTAASVAVTAEPTRTVDPNVLTGTFTGTKATTRPPLGVTTSSGSATPAATDSAAQVVLSFAAVLVALLVAM